MVGKCRLKEISDAERASPLTTKPARLMICVLETELDLFHKSLRISFEFE